MQQQINLLTDDLRRRKEPLTFNQLLVVWGVFGLLLGLLTTWDGISIWQLTSKHELSKEQTAMLTKANTALKAEFDVSTDPELQAAVDELRALRAEQRQLMNLLLGYQSDQQGGFSAYLDDLSRHALDGMWLSEIVLEAGGTRIALKGSTTDAILLPKFLQSLSEGSSFEGHLFDEFMVQEAKGGLLDFDIIGPHQEVSG